MKTNGLGYVSYDKNGNITNLKRYNLHFNTQGEPESVDVIDELSYFYKPNSNQLMKVNDQAYDEGFKNGNNTGDDYVYDANGNMTGDKNKDITITYNHLNLPVKVSKDYDAEGYIEYTYSATGEKLKKKVVDVDNNSTIYTMYEGNFIYGAIPGQESRLKLFFQPEGYVEPVDPTDYTQGFGYVYQYKDHWGNVRLSYSDSNGDGSIDPNTEIKETMAYYPFGMMFNHQVNSGSSNPYQTYQNKELEKELGLNWHDFGARRFMADIGRTTTLDPLAEDFYDVSPYAFLNNSPPNFIDPTGMSAEWIPKVNDDGSTSYIAEEGDSAATLADQYEIGEDLSESEQLAKAEEITNSTGNDKIEKGTEVSGLQLLWLFYKFRFAITKRTENNYFKKSAKSKNI